ncbi:hypothetical protein M409DRAFT_56769 [Zasmidium cellare ATCC 36951]|uniref:Uncharacterized protein n=1 Tax=Zasmidium cellare ATCC 36951 TaxID=1080233 RepID=A0A6A6CBT3_ZASCE|nr:uncharacterized protein M409DRAFT_56769 [Zasmidium cellare ATCC 36951]KAF2164515.1 hypothetical protein M409DRAFT_56769 [Zasmidium cellare ATCC 36951]
MPNNGEDLTHDCPFPDVAEALRPFIKTRQEVTAIRQGLQTTLPLSSISLGQTSADVDPSSLSGVRKAYWRALEAHKKAQSRYESLKTELDQLVLGEASGLPAPTTEDSDSFLTENYVPLIRQKEKHRKLKVIEASLARIDAAGQRSVGESLDNVAKREIGELPVPPTSASLPDRDAEFNAEYDLTQLKKAILSTKQQLNDHERAVVSLNGVDRGDVNPHADLKALQKAHNELTLWMESQLAVISDTDGTNGMNGVTSAESDTNGDVTFNINDIEDLYEQYLEARRRLLDTVANPPSPQLTSRPSSPVVRRGSETTEVDNRTATSELVMPYLTALTSKKQHEQDLLQQSTFARRQAASSEAQTQAVLSRLADESHLLAPELGRGPPKGKDWAKAAAVAEKTTEDYTTQRTKSGLAATEAAAKAMESIQRLPSSYDTLLK